MAEGAHPVDVVVDDLIDSYRAGIRRLEFIIRAALRRGLDPDRIGTGDQRPGDATAAYRARQLAQARAILAELERAAGVLAAHAAAGGYQAGTVAVDRVLDAEGLGRPGVAGRFGGIHQRQVSALAGNLGRSLERAAQTAGTNVAAVFARADLLEGALPPNGAAGLPNFIGRRANDAWRQAALETIGAGKVALDTRQQISAALAQRLINDGTADALTGFVDAAGRRWPLDTYAEMAARTTAREAASRATVNRLGEHGHDLVTVSSHPHPPDECDPYDGETFSLSGDDETYDELDVIPPFHPRCLHVLGPAEVSFDRYLDDLEQAAGDVAERGPMPVDATPPGDAPIPEAAGAPSGFAPPPFGPAAEASRDAGTAARLEAQSRIDAVTADPGPEPGAAQARAAAQDREQRIARRAELAEQRAATAAIDEALGPDVVAALDDFRRSGLAWAGERELREAILAGDLTIDDVTDMAERELAGREGRRHRREELKEQEGLNKRAFPCFVCGRLKRRPADVCDHCGDDPVTYGGSAAEFNRAYGYSH